MPVRSPVNGYTTAKGQERFCWLLLPLQAIIVPITPSRTSNRIARHRDAVRCEHRPVALLHPHGLGESPWERLWERSSGGAPKPLSGELLLLALRLLVGIYSYIRRNQ